MNFKKLQPRDLSQLQTGYDLAVKQYAELGIDVQKAVETLKTIPISLHCWQGDDVGGFETPDATLSGGGIQTTGNYPGKARTIAELRQDYEKALSLIPGKHRANIHAIYGDFQGKKVDRDEIEVEHFSSWINWAKDQGIGLDFNPTLFSHPKAESGFTLSHPDKAIREFWIEHCQRTREISEAMGKALGTASNNNLWIPDGSKDIPVDRWGLRQNLIESLDTLFAKKRDPLYTRDSIEGKLFGIGSEAFVVGSNDFYLGYASKHNLMLTMDMGHYHPTESVADKISAVLPFTNHLLLHVSRGVRWDSDHVVLLNDDIQTLSQEIVRTQQLDKIHIALDFFDASINRIGAWVTGTRATLKGLLYALLEPTEILQEFERTEQKFQRLALLEELKTLPFGAIWDYYCQRQAVPVGIDWISDVEEYEKTILCNR